MVDRKNKQIAPKLKMAFFSNILTMKTKQTN